MMTSNLFDLSGRVALVVGASRGIGRGIAQGLAEAGAIIALCSRTATDLHRAAEEILALGVRVGSICRRCLEGARHPGSSPRGSSSHGADRYTGERGGR